jgi:hypothetical protein
MLTPGRCDPQASVGGTDVGVGGHGNAGLGLRLKNLPGQFAALPMGAFGTSDAYVAVLATFAEVTFTSHAPSTSEPNHGSVTAGSANSITL